MIPTTHFVIRIALVLVCLCAAAFGQDAKLPDNFAAAGLGFQSTATPQTSGWSEYCHRNPDLNLFGLSIPSYGCASTDYSGQVTSARIDVKSVLLAKGGIAGGTVSGAGAAVNTNGVGASYAVGGWGASDFPGRALKMPGLQFVASATWQKSDVAVAQQQAGAIPVLRQLAARSVWRLGFGKTW